MFRLYQIKAHDYQLDFTGFSLVQLKAWQLLELVNHLISMKLAFGIWVVLGTSGFWIKHPEWGFSFVFLRNLVFDGKLKYAMFYNVHIVWGKLNKQSTDTLLLQWQTWVPDNNTSGINWNDLVSHVCLS